MIELIGVTCGSVPLKKETTKIKWCLFVPKALLSFWENSSLYTARFEDALRSKHFLLVIVTNLTFIYMQLKLARRISRSIKCSEKLRPTCRDPSHRVLTCIFSFLCFSLNKTSLFTLVIMRASHVTGCYSKESTGLRLARDMYHGVWNSCNYIEWAMIAAISY